jgi:hypothetical protein
MKRNARSSAFFLISLALVAFAFGLALANSPLLYEDFNDGVADGFTVVGGTWSVIGGQYHQTTATPAGPYRSWVNVISAYTIDIDCAIVSGEEAKVIYAHAADGENYRVDFWLNQSRLSIPAWGQPATTRQFTMGGLSLTYEVPFHVRIGVNQTAVKVWVNGVPQHEQLWADGVPLGDGKVGLGTYSSVSWFDNLRVYAGSAIGVLLYEDFEDLIADGFTELNGVWVTIDGVYTQLTSSPGGPYRSYVDAVKYIIEVDCTPISGEETRIIYAHSDTGEHYRVDFWPYQSRLTIPAFGQDWSTRNVTLGGLELSYNQTYRVRIQVDQRGVKVWLNDILRHDEPWADDMPLGDARIGLGTYAASSSFDNLNVYAAPLPVGGIWYVDGNMGASGDGTTWPKAFRTIQEGIDAASDGDIVVVAVDTYFENIRFKGKNITLRGTDPLDPAFVFNTIIDGHLGTGPVVTFAGTEAEGCVLSGLNIAYGTAAVGGGICGGTAEMPTHATIKNCAVGGNSADDGAGIAWCDGPIHNNGIGGNWYLATYPQGNGGGLFQCNGDILNNEISKNTAYTGGGLCQCNGRIWDNTIEENSATEGGGIAYCPGTIRRNNIAGNYAYSGGGLAYCHGTIEKNTVGGNTSYVPLGFGGGLYRCNGTIRNNTIAGNLGGQGGGLAFCDSLIESNLISSNGAEGEGVWYSGGGLYACSAYIHNNTIIGNASNRDGGGLGSCGGTTVGNLIAENSADNMGGGFAYCDGVIRNNTIMGNTAYDGGGLAQCGSRIQNNLVAVNTAHNRGGGLFDCDGPILSNTITSNSARTEGGGLSYCNLIIKNCIIWGNSSTTGEPQLSDSSTPTYSCIQGWGGGGEGNITSDPGFVDADGPDNDPLGWRDNNYRLKEGSPCIDRGINESWMWTAVDLDGNPRVFVGEKFLTVDMGAYEYASFPFRIVKVEKTASGQQRLTWNSRAEDVYVVWSSESSPGQSWISENKVASQGASTTWTDPYKMKQQKFYKVELVQ